MPINTIVKSKGNDKYYLYEEDWRIVDGYLVGYFVDEFPGPLFSSGSWHYNGQLIFDNATGINKIL